MNTITVPAEYPVLLPQRSLVKEHLVETAPCVVYFGFYFLCLRQCNPSNKNAFTLITNWLGPEISSITKLLTLQAWGHKFNYQYPKFRKKEEKSWFWWHMLLIPALRRQKQKDPWVLTYLLSPRLERNLFTKGQKHLKRWTVHGEWDLKLCCAVHEMYMRTLTPKYVHSLVHTHACSQSL